MSHTHTRTHARARAGDTRNARTHARTRNARTHQRSLKCASGSVAEPCSSHLLHYRRTEFMLSDMYQELAVIERRQPAGAQKPSAGEVVVE